ncbi:MAG: YiiX/YebB-like N1pC/P60 family cysteine hydrolase [Betaproteobacteria bacterium]|nr:YiiX/YebB-like N1pC/P60 family cysteine hydrolase [Betaproteobacteria bacterium]MDH5222749.1 YiiX/YebB-like N1pC/P60 family cysteine hydrolase [Betaproteobacteria bacterium]
MTQRGLLGVLLACGVALAGAAELRVPQHPGASTTIPLPRDLGEGIRMFRAGIASPEFNAATCASFLNAIYDNLWRAAPGHFDLAAAKRDAGALVRAIFEAKLDLRRQLARLEGAGPVPRDCVTAMRNTMRASLFMSEYLAEHFVPAAREARVFAGGEPSLLLYPQFGPALALQSGDVLLSRGDAFVSGAIARLGDVDGNFSHVALVYVDPGSREAFTIEAHIEIGSVVAPLEKYLTDGKSRAVVFRHPDAALAAEAARLIAERVRKASAGAGNIPYDFGMVMDGPRADAELFCSEVASVGYALASGGGLQLPRYRTVLRMKNDAFLKAIGIAAEASFAPSDLEVETRLALVAEWRNLGKTQRSRMTDAVITHLYWAMDERGYRLRNTTGDALKRDFAYTTRQLPLFGALLEERFPRNMPRRTLGMMLALDRTAEAMLARLEQANAEQVRRTGIAMTGAQMQAFLRALPDAVFRDSFRPAGQ